MSIDRSFPSAYNSSDGSEHEGASENFKVSEDALPPVKSPSIVPEQSSNLNILKSLQDEPPKPMPGTNYQSHPYWKNR